MSNKIYIGQLQHRVFVYKRTQSKGTMGEAVFADVMVGASDRWAKVEDVSGTEEEDGKVFALNVRRYTVVYEPVIAALEMTDLIIVDGADRYNIHSVSFIGRKDYIQFKCSKSE